MKGMGVFTAQMIPKSYSRKIFYRTYRRCFARAGGQGSLGIDPVYI